jgi:hypothetical protein
VLKTLDIGLRRGSGGVGEAEFDAVADCAVVVAEPCLRDVPLADLASRSERHGWSDESAVGRHLFRLFVFSPSSCNRRMLRLLAWIRRGLDDVVATMCDSRIRRSDYKYSMRSSGISMSQPAWFAHGSSQQGSDSKYETP